MFQKNALGLIVLALLLALLLRQSSLALICALLLLSSGLASLWSRLSLRRIEYHRHLSQPAAFPDDQVTLTIRMTNRKILPLPSIQVFDRLPAQLQVLDAKTISAGAGGGRLLDRQTGLRWYESIVWRCTITPTARGAYRIGPVQLSSGDPFGLYPADDEQPATESLIVYPRLMPLAALGLPPNHPLGDVRGGRLLRDPLRTVGVRDYAPSDPLRDLHWKATARTGTLQTRIYELTTAHAIAIFLDLDTFEFYYEGIDPELIERMISVAATLATASLKQGYAIGLYVNGAPAEDEHFTRLPPGRHPSQLAVVMETLARLTPYSILPMARLLRSNNDLPAGTTIILVGSVNSEALRAALLRQREQGRPVTWLFMGTGSTPEVPGVRVIRPPT